jgi:CysZ protein
VIGIIPAFFASLAQVPSRAFMKVALIGIIAALLVLGSMWWGLDGWLSHYDSITKRGTWWAKSIGWLADHGAVGITLLASWFLFPALASMVIGALLDDIVDAVEAKHYPNHSAPTPIGMVLGIKLGVRSGLRLIVINLMLLPAYIILSFTIIGAFALYMLVNGFLLGRDYVQMVAIRHGGAVGDDRFRKKYPFLVLAVGMITSGLFLVPFVNLFAPLIGAAMATHLFHQRRDHA